MNKNLIVDIDDKIIAIGINLVPSEDESDVVFLDGAGYGLYGQKIYENIEIPDYVVVDKYKYINGNFVVNEQYSIPFEKKIQQLEDDINMLIELQADIIGGAI